MIDMTRPESASKRKRNRASKIDSVLEEATRQFNARGVAGAQLSKVAEKVGLTRGTLYHYFTDREDLVFRCYLRTCSITADRIEAVGLKGRNGLERILAYVTDALAPSATPLSVISDTDYLTSEHRTEIELAHRRNLGGLQQFIVAGQTDGSIRACDPKIAAQIIFGIQTWLSLAPTWLTDSRAHVDALEDVVALLSDGIAADPEAPLRLRRDFPTFSAPARSSFDREHAKEAKREELILVASRIFNRKSVDGTSIEHIAAELGATPGAIYYYFQTKSALVLGCYERAYDIYNRQSDMAAAAGRTGLERLLYTVYFAVQSAEASPLVVFTGAEDLPAKGRRRIVDRLRGLIERAESFYRDGVADGSLRPLHALPTVLALGGSVQRASQWHTWGALYDQQSTADEIVALFARGLRNRQGPSFERNGSRA
ncbi:MAG: hypothetical protein JWO83_2085 [Caulobacteraceae bacterium]|nr:hypothetical protein [Caulobacteraceae bacterium]